MQFHERAYVTLVVIHEQNVYYKFYIEMVYNLNEQPNALEEFVDS